MKRLVQVLVLAAVVAGVVAASASSFAIVDDTQPPIGEVGKPYAFRPEIHGGGAPFEFHTAPPGALPAGMYLGQDDACICGTPLEAKTVTFTIVATCCFDGPNPVTTDQNDFTLQIRPQLGIATTSLKIGSVGAPYSATLAATGAGGYKIDWSLSAGALPAGLTLASDGTISGTPTAVGTSFFTVRAKDDDGGPRNVTQALSLSVSTPLTAAASGPVPQAEVAQPFKLALTSSGGLPPTSWSITGGAAPAGVTVDAATGLVSGTPTAAGTFTFAVTAADSGGQTATVNVTMEVARALKLLPAKLRAGVVAKRYAAKLRVLGGVAPNTFKFVGKHPSWLRLNARTGVLSGKPTKAGIFRFTAKVTDSLKAVSTKKFTLTVRAY